MHFTTYQMTAVFTLALVAAACAPAQPGSADVPSAVAEGILPGQRAPDFALSDAEGRTVRLSDFRGKVVLLEFSAIW